MFVAIRSVARGAVQTCAASKLRAGREQLGADEGVAPLKRIDMWSGDFEMPWDWRAPRRNY